MFAPIARVARTSGARAPSLGRFAARLRSAAGRLRRDEGGAVVLMVAGSIVSILVAVGGAIDVYRYEMLRKRAQNTLDRAVLAAAALDQKISNSEEVVRSYMRSAGLDLPAGTEFTACPKAGPSVCCPAEAKAANLSKEIELQCLTDWRNYKNTFRSVNVSTTYELPMAFLWLAGEKSWDVPVQAAAIERERQVEISLVLDISGSMGDDITGKSQRKIDALKPAAEMFVDTMLAGDREREQTSISIVPYSGQTSLGRRMFDHLAGSRYSRAHDYSSCFRLADDDFRAGVPNFSRRQQVAHYTPWEAHESRPPADPDLRAEYIYDGADRRWRPDPLFKKNSYVSGAWEVNSAWWMCPPDAHLWLTRDPGQFELVGSSGTPLPGTVRWPDLATLRDPSVPSLVDERELPVWKDAIWNHVGECGRADTREQMHCSEEAGATIPAASKRTVKQAYRNGDLVYVDDPASITYLSNDPDYLKQRIRDLPLFGSTGTDVALKYAYMLIDPAFRSKWSGFLGKHSDEARSRPAAFAQRPGDFSEPGTYKYIVLMTDGVIKGQKGMTDSAYGRAEGPIQYSLDLYENAAVSERLYAGTETANNAAAADRFAALCGDVAANNVVVFTIGFDLGGTDEQSVAMRKLLRDCASSESHYFDVDDGDIQGAFQAIAATIQRVRLTS